MVNLCAKRMATVQKQKKATNYQLFKNNFVNLAHAKFVLISKDKKSIPSAM